MDLRPINPYYKRTPQVMLMALAEEYSYPYDWIPPVTDRTAADVEHARELLSLYWQDMTADQRTEYLAGLKGCLNREDLERIENNIQILLDVLELPGTSNVGAVPEFPTERYFAQMRVNALAIREGYAVHADTPQVPELPYNTWQAYNDIEKILEDVYEVVSAQFHYYAGNEIYAGDATGLLL